MNDKIYFDNFPVTFDEINTFLLVLKHESFAVVSDIQELTRVKVMRRVNKFEDIFNARFFDRSYKMLKRTRSGVHIFKVLSYYEHRISKIYQQIGTELHQHHEFNILLPNFVMNHLINDLVEIVKKYPEHKINLISHYGQEQHNLMEFDLILAPDTFHPERSHWFKEIQNIAFPQGIYENKNLSENKESRSDIIKIKESINDLKIYNNSVAIEACNNFFYEKNLPEILINDHQEYSLTQIDKALDYHATLYTVDSINPYPEVLAEMVGLVSGMRE